MSELSSRIIETAKQLKVALEMGSDHPNVLCLREFGRYCTRFTFDTNDSFEKFVTFVLSKYLDDLILNFNVDAVYSAQLHQARLEIYNHLYLSLQSIGDDLMNNETLKIVRSLSDIINLYIDKVNYINNNNNNNTF